MMRRFFSNNYNLNNQNGITVLTLIITVFILITLIGLTINIAVDGRLFNNAEESTNRVNSIMEYENLEMQNILETKQDIEDHENSEYLLKNEIYRKGINFFIVRAQAISPNNNNIIYELYISTTINGEYTKVAQSASTTSNTELLLRPNNNLVNNAQYYWYIIVKDATSNTEITRSIIKPVKLQKPNLPEHAGERVVQKTPYKYGSKFYSAQIPAGFTVSGNSNEYNVENGLVIYYINSTGTNAMTDDEIEAIDWEDSEVMEDLKTKYDQFVWIPVDDANEMFMCQLSGTTGVNNLIKCNIKLANNVPTCIVHNSTAIAGRLYCESDGTFSFTNTIETFSNSSYREPAAIWTTSSPYDLVALQSEYNSIVKSILLNKGFWVGRYETTDIGESNITIVAGKTPGNSNWFDAYDKQKEYANDKNLLGGMISGAAFDQVMKFVHDVNNYDVTTVGNVGHSFNGKYNSGSKPSDSSKNIYDLEGNVNEWTTESYGLYNRVLRGNSYGNGRTYPASYRANSLPNQSYAAYGTRSAIYLPIN